MIDSADMMIEEDGFESDYLSLAVAPAPESVFQPQDARHSSAQFVGANRVLIVDDDPQIQRLLSQVARRVGYETIAADTIDSALESIQGGAALVLLDLQLDGCDGLGLIDRLSLSHPGTPIVLMSGCDPRLLTMAENACKEHDCTIAGVLSKPFEMSALATILKRYRRDTAETARQRLEQAMRAGAIVPHYQPIVDLQTGILAGAEALVRWEHPELGLLSPANIIPQAEENGLMPDLTFLMLEQAIRDWGNLPADYRNLNVAVNVSPSVLADDHLVVKVVELLKAYDLPPERLTLEITESASLLEVPKVRTALCRLRLLGVELSLDDFGTGYSSLLALRDLPFNKVKLDRAFVTYADAQPEQLAIATSVTRLVHDLNLKLVGEGIESQQCFDLSRQIGMDYGQGFLIARPIAYNDFRKYAGMQPSMN